uniref:R3H domain-containing protein n=1 Tax=Steinernema glaseri TaxID=37863 RepID=A0A1I7ZUS8_9BILA
MEKCVSTHKSFHLDGLFFALQKSAKFEKKTVNEHVKFVPVLNKEKRSGKKVSTSAGFEPAIFGSVDRRVIHCATRPHNIEIEQVQVGPPPAPSGRQSHPHDFLQNVNSTLHSDQ